jgi:hypothetical protein
MPAIAQASTCGRSAGAGHSPDAAIPTATSRPIPAPSTACAAASTANDGAAALSPEPTATSAAPALSSSRRPGRRAAVARTSAITPPVAPEIDRSCPAVAVETPNSRATSIRVGDRTSIADWDAKRHANSTALGWPD